MSHPSVVRERVLSCLGPHALGPALFYAHEPALRFELARADGAVRRFTEAYDRARQVLEHVFAASSNLTIILGLHGAPPLTRHLAVFRAARHVGVRLSKPTEVWSERSAGCDDGARTYVACRSEKSDLPGWLWGALSQDLGITPTLACDLYLVDLDAGVLAHPYDDRGMDVISADVQRLGELYVRFNGYLLHYDRARMDAFFASSCP